MCIMYCDCLRASGPERKFVLNHELLVACWACCAGWIQRGYQLSYTVRRFVNLGMPLPVPTVGIIHVF